MSVGTKFLFERRFDDGAAKAPPPKKKSFTAAEHEEAMQQAREAGVAAGRAAAAKEIEARSAATLDAMRKAIAPALADLPAILEQHMRAAVGAAVEVVRRLYPTLAERNDLAEIEALARECLSHLAGEPRLVVRVADAELDTLKPRLDAVATQAGFAGRVILFADPQLQPGQVRIEWADGGAERDPARIWSEIDGVLAQFINPAIDNNTAAT